MPSITPSHIYSFFALIAVSSILISAFTAYTATFRTIPEWIQLEKIVDLVASRAYELVTLAAASDSSSTIYLSLPPAVGNNQYWIRLRNQASKAWVEGGLGPTAGAGKAVKEYLPNQVSASGNYTCDYSRAVLECSIIDSSVSLRLKIWSEDI
ncbi:MAG: hypothetical protein JSV64_08880 [Candidatus Bathyarchaeota archaeon]|nr:MAG: hypothetical protein JSV64_08880 [Candidatus Bathyarchaeota archaeon]